MLEQETAELQRVKGKLEEETKRLRRDLELNEQQMQEYAQDRFRHSKKAKDLESKVKNLEKSLAQVVKDFERERERLVSKGQSDLHQTSVENTGLRKLVKLKEREHTKIKRLASDIIAQRSEVEQFFLEALEQVREEITKERSKPPPAGPERANRDGPGSTFLTEESSTHFQGSLPKIKGMGGRGGTQAPQYIPNQRVDIRDLHWEDKERVLRLLFAKINQSQIGGGAGGLAGGVHPQMDAEQTEQVYDDYDDRSHHGTRGGSVGAPRVQGHSSSLRQPAFA